MVESSIHPNILLSPPGTEQVNKAGKLTTPKEYISILRGPENVGTKVELVESSSKTPNFSIPLLESEEPSPKKDIARVESSSDIKCSATFKSSSRNPSENAKTKSYLAPAFESSPEGMNFFALLLVSSVHPNSRSNDTKEQDWFEGSRSSVKFVQKVETERRARRQGSFLSQVCLFGAGFRSSSL